VLSVPAVRRPKPKRRTGEAGRRSHAPDGGDLPAGDIERSAPARTRALARAAALRLLARKPRTVVEVEAALVRRGFVEDTVQETVARLREARLLEDATVADAIVREAARRRLGSRRVAQILARRGVARDLREPAMAASAAAEALLARELVVRRFPGGVPSDRRGAARAIRMLLGRGFSAAAARRALGIDVAIDDLDEGHEPEDA